MSLNKHQQGQGFVEYALILLLVAVVVIIIVSAFVPAIQNTWQHAAKLLTPVSAWTEEPVAAPNPDK